MNKDYIKSNEIIEVSLKRFSKKWSESVLECDDNLRHRQCESQNLMDYLCDKFKVRRVGIWVSDRCRPHKRGGELYGFYDRLNNRITIYNRTTHRGNVTSIKSFYDTLLHEFMHHYDYEVLKLGDSLHTSGFYKRISDLKNKLQ